MELPKRKPKVLVDTADPALGVVVRDRETTSIRIREKRANPYRWCFCELCWRSTEWVSNQKHTVFKRLRNGNAKAVPKTDAIHNEARRWADQLVARYEKALAGEFGPYEASAMLSVYCDAQERRGDSSVAEFRDQVERRTLMAIWARQGDLLSIGSSENQPTDAPKPSRLYCEAHNPRRSNEARRAYQRDRRLLAVYEELISVLWSEHAHELPTWDIEAHAEVRKKAYENLQLMKSPYEKVEKLLMAGNTNQSKIAKQLGVTRQAVSVAIKRRALKNSSRSSGTN
ncbi:MAG: hypothetical protein WAV85_17650 [Rhodoferax sp.]